MQIQGRHSSTSLPRGATATVDCNYYERDCVDDDDFQISWSLIMFCKRGQKSRASRRDGGSAVSRYTGLESISHQDQVLSLEDMRPGRVIQKEHARLQ